MLVHGGRHINQPVMLQIAAMMMQAFNRCILGRNGGEINHGKIAALGKVTRLIEDVSHATRHAGGKVPPRVADDQHAAARHVFAAVVANPFDNRNGAGIAHREALARHAAEIAFAGDGAVKHRIADDDGFFRNEADLLLRLHDELAAGQALADIVIGLAREFKGDAMRRPGPKALARNAIELHRDRVFRQSRMAIALGHFARKHGARRAVRCS